MSGLAELGLDPRLLVTVRAADVDRRVADGRRRAGLRCGWRRRARSLGRDAAARSRRQPQADAGRAGLGRHRPVAADGGGAPAVDGRDTMDRARGAFAAGVHCAPCSAWGAPLLDAQLVRNRHGPVGRWIMEWKCDECLFGKPAAYPQPVAAAPAHRPHQAPVLPRQRRERFQARGTGSRKKTRQQNSIMNPASSSPSKTTRCRFLRSTTRPRVSASMSACRSPMPAPSALRCGCTMPMKPPTPTR